LDAENAKVDSVAINMLALIQKAFSRKAVDVDLYYD